MQQIVSQCHETFFFFKIEKYSCNAKISRFLHLLNTANVVFNQKELPFDGRALLLLLWWVKLDQQNEWKFSV